MDNYSMFMPNYSIGSDVYDNIAEICGLYGNTAVVIGGHKAMSAAKDALDTALSGSPISICDYVWYGGECSYNNAEAVAQLSSVKNADMIFAVGGGKATDTAKLIADMLGKPVFAFPTIASNCSCCTSVSIMYTDEGVFIKPRFFSKPPVHSFINTQIIAQSPTKYLWAGMGDTYAKYYEATASARGEICEHFTAFGVAASKMCVDPILQYGKSAMEAISNNKVTYEFSQVVLAICVTTGIVSIMLTKDLTPDYNSGLAHAVFYALTSIEEVEKNHLHGEIVAFGILLMLLVDKNTTEFEKIYLFNKSVKLPTRISDIGISRKQFEDIADKIPDMSDIRHWPYRVTTDMILDAVDYLENYTINNINMI